jgi:hypothetical protein
MFQRYVAIVSDECCKSISECCNGYTHMLQKSVPNVLSVFLDVLLQVCLSERCIRFTHMLQVFIWILRMFAMVFKCFLCVFASVSETCLKCFIYLRTYVESVAFGCFKSRLGVVHVAMRVRSGGDASSPRTRSCGAGPAWAHETPAQVGACCFFSCKRGRGVDCRCEFGKLQRGLPDMDLGPDIRALVFPFLFSCLF